jgi:hypothetical protein
MYFDLEEEQAPSLHISKKNKKISFILGAGDIETAQNIEEDKENKNNTNNNYVINFIFANQVYQKKKNYSINTLYDFIVSFFKL